MKRYFHKVKERLWLPFLLLFLIFPVNAHAGWVGSDGASDLRQSCNSNASCIGQTLVYPARGAGCSEANTPLPYNVNKADNYSSCFIDCVSACQNQGKKQSCSILVSTQDAVYNGRSNACICADNLLQLTSIFSLCDGSIHTIAIWPKQTSPETIVLETGVVKSVKTLDPADTSATIPTQIPPARKPSALPLTCRQRLYLQGTSTNFINNNCTLSPNINGADANGLCTDKSGCACAVTKEKNCTVKEGKSSCYLDASVLGKEVTADTIDNYLRNMTLSELDPDPYFKKFLWKGNFHAVCLKCGECSVDDFLQVLVNFITGLLGFIGGLALCWFIFGAFTLTMSRGNPEGVEKGKGMMINTVIGLVVVLSAWLIVNFTLVAISGGDAMIFGKDWYKVQLTDQAAEKVNQTNSNANNK